jgi:hypothetical protein
MGGKIGIASDKNGWSERNGFTWNYREAVRDPVLRHRLRHRMGRDHRIVLAAQP